MVDDARQPVEMQPLSAREVLAELMGNSFAVDWIDALGWQHRRLNVLARAASTVPILRLRYPRGMDRLPQVRQAILDICIRPSGTGR